MTETRARQAEVVTTLAWFGGKVGWGSEGGFLLRWEELTLDDAGGLGPRGRRMMVVLA